MHVPSIKLIERINYLAIHVESLELKSMINIQEHKDEDIKTTCKQEDVEFELSIQNILANKLIQDNHQSI